MDWLAALAAHTPDRGQQMVRYYGWYSNKSRGIRRKAPPWPKPRTLPGFPLDTLPDD
ncbi:MAG: hypothetical protein HY673_27470 [Chloroflexi bacterium]|nr:hypothetical protein [Chloroflexota bacterium]